MVAYPIWRDQCTCPGAAQARQRRTEVRAERDARREKMRNAMADVDIGRNRSAADIERDMKRAAEAHGFDTDPAMLRVMSQSLRRQLDRGCSCGRG
jgi:hypothetical protein